MTPACSAGSPENGVQAAAARLLEQGDAEAALAEIAQCLESAESPAAYILQARALAGLRRFDAAHDALVRAFALDAQCMEAHFALGKLHRRQKALPLAAACFEQVLGRSPGHVEALYELGSVYQELNRLPEALARLELAHELAPADPRIANQLAIVLVAQEQYGRGIALLEEICARTSSAVVRPRINLSNALLRLGRFARALEVLEEVLEVEPDNVEARWNRSHFLLGMGRYEEGWRDYDYRVLLKSRPVRLLPFAEWAGEPLQGKRVLIAAEQGLGDELMFASCIPEVLACASEVHIECEHRLARLFARSFPGAKILASDHEAQPPWMNSAPDLDCFVRAGSLPRYLRNSPREFPAHRGYLRADEARVEHWRARLAALGPGMKIGLSWRGGTASTRAGARSIPLEGLAAILEVSGCEFVSLQYGEVDGEIGDLRRMRGRTVHHWKEAIADYDETAALVSALDLVISVQTALIHLTGALGKPAWVLVPAAPEWRYGIAGEGMPWYPSIRLFRQQHAGAWQETLARIVAALRAFKPGGVTSV